MTEPEIINAHTGELVTLPLETRTLFGTNDPREVLLEAKRHADVLADVVKERKLFTVIGGKAHVHVEAWTMLGSQVGVFAVPEGEPEWVEIEGVGGFRATVKAVTRDGQVVGGASALCMRDEGTWKSRPIHTLAAMAETRATSRALRKPLGFIVQLAGYSATAAEEMTPEDRPAKREVVNKSSTRKATDAQHKKLGAIIGELDPEKVPEGHADWEAYSRWYANQLAGVESRKDLTVTQMSDVIEHMQAADVPFG